MFFFFFFYWWVNFCTLVFSKLNTFWCNLYTLCLYFLSLIDNWISNRHISKTVHFSPPNSPDRIEHPVREVDPAESSKLSPMPRFCSQEHDKCQKAVLRGGWLAPGIHVYTDITLKNNVLTQHSDTHVDQIVIVRYPVSDRIWVWAGRLRTADLIVNLFEKDCLCRLISISQTWDVEIVYNM